MGWMQIGINCAGIKKKTSPAQREVQSRVMTMDGQLAGLNTDTHIEDAGWYRTQ